MNKPMTLAEIQPAQWPRNVEAEQALLGAILLNNAVLERITGMISADMFYEPVHGEIYDAIVEAIESGLEATPVLLAPLFLDHPDLKDVGGAGYLARLAGAATTILNAPDYARSIRDLYLRRRLMQIADQMTMAASDSRAMLKAPKIIAEIETALFELSGSIQGMRTAAGMDTVARDVLQTLEIAKANPGGVTGVPTGLSDLDRLLGGMNGGDYILLGGRPSMGKTALALSIARNVARSGKGVLFFSMEMPRDQLGLRLASMQGYSTTTPVPYANARRGLFDDHQWLRFETAAKSIASLPITIDDRPGMTVAAIKMAIRRALDTWQAQGIEPGVIIIDYLGLVTMGDRYKGNRVNEIAEASKAMKQMALEFHLPFLVLSQLSRGVEGREDKKPTLADLRDSGALEQDADVVLFCYREYYYRKDENGLDTDALHALETRGEVIIAKQRNGPTRSVDLFFDAPHGLWSNRY